MNTENRTLASPEMMKAMREADEALATGYREVPKEMEREARRILAGRHIADMPKGFNSRVKKLETKLGNARHENALLKAKEKLRAEGLLR